MNFGLRVASGSTNIGSGNRVIGYPTMLYYIMSRSKNREKCEVKCTEAHGIATIGSEKKIDRRLIFHIAEKILPLADHNEQKSWWAIKLFANRS